MKNIDYVIKKTAADLGLSEEKVRPIIMEYWRTYTSNIIKVGATTTVTRHIGNFTISRYKLNNYIKKLLGKIKRMRKLKTVSDEKRQECLDTYMKNLRTALGQRNTLAIHYQKMFKKDGQGK